MKPRDVWVTGVGSLTAAGAGADAASAILRSGARSVDAVLGRVPDLVLPRPARHLDRSAGMFLAAAEEAWSHASLGDAVARPDRAGVIEGSSLGPLAGCLAAVRERVATADASPPRPTGLIRFMTGAGGAAFAQVHGLLGPVVHLSAGSVSAACAIGEAYRKIRAGEADVLVAGGAECPLQQDVLDLFRAAGLLGAACLPFDPARAGTVLGEGAGVLVLEAAAHATHRGVEPLAIVRGYGLASESYSMTRPDPEGRGVTAAARLALGRRPWTQLGWIKAHGTGTKLNDAAECRGLARLLGATLPAIPLTSLKPALGHCLGASGAVEAVVAVMALREGIVPPTLGTTTVDPELPPCTVALECSPAPASRALLLSESFGGRCAALVISRN